MTGLEGRPTTTPKTCRRPIFRSQYGTSLPLAGKARASNRCLPPRKTRADQPCARGCSLLAPSMANVKSSPGPLTICTVRSSTKATGKLRRMRGGRKRPGSTYAQLADHQGARRCRERLSKHERRVNLLVGTPEDDGGPVVVQKPKLSPRPGLPARPTAPVRRPRRRRTPRAGSTPRASICAPSCASTSRSGCPSYLHS